MEIGRSKVAFLSIQVPGNRGGDLHLLFDFCRLIAFEGFSKFFHRNNISSHKKCIQTAMNFSYEKFYGIGLAEFSFACYVRRRSFIQCNFPVKLELWKMLFVFFSILISYKDLFVLAGALLQSFSSNKYWTSASPI